MAGETSSPAVPDPRVGGNPDGWRAEWRPRRDKLDGNAITSAEARAAANARAREEAVAAMSASVDKWLQEPVPPAGKRLDECIGTLRALMHEAPEARDRIVAAHRLAELSKPEPLEWLVDALGGEAEALAWMRERVGGLERKLGVSAPAPAAAAQSPHLARIRELLGAMSPEERAALGVGG